MKVWVAPLAIAPKSAPGAGSRSKIVRAPAVNADLGVARAAHVKTAAIATRLTVSGPIDIAAQHAALCAITPRW